MSKSKSNKEKDLAQLDEMFAFNHSVILNIYEENNADFQATLQTLLGFNKSMIVANEPLPEQDNLAEQQEALRLAEELARQQREAAERFRRIQLQEEEAKQRRIENEARKARQLEIQRLALEEAQRKLQERLQAEQAENERLEQERQRLAKEQAIREQQILEAQQEEERRALAEQAERVRQAEEARLAEEEKQRQIELEEARKQEEERLRQVELQYQLELEEQRRNEEQLAALQQNIQVDVQAAHQLLVSMNQLRIAQERILSSSSELSNQSDQTKPEQPESDQQTSDKSEPLIENQEQQEQQHDIATQGVSIYFRNDDLSEDAAKRKKELEDILSEFGFADRKDINVGADFELIGALKEQNSAVTFPCVFAAGRSIGDATKLREIGAEGLKQQLIEATAENQQKDWSATYVGQNFFDRCIDATEYVISSFNSLLWLPVTIFRWSFSSAKPEEKVEEFVDFAVVISNWYYRNQRRIFRVKNDHYCRMHPNHMDVRAVHPFSTISNIERKTPTYIVINFNDGSASEYVSAQETVLDSMIALFEEKSSRKLVSIPEQPQEQQEQPKEQESASQEASEEPTQEGNTQVNQEVTQDAQ